MGKVSALQIEGLELFFNSMDHLPPHFHAEKTDEWEVRVLFLRAQAEMVEVVWSVRPPPKKVLKELCEAAERARQDLLPEWEQKVLVTSPGEEE